MEELVCFCGALENIRMRRLSTMIKSRREGENHGKWETYELVINPTNDTLNCRTQHLMQPNMSTIPFLRARLRIHHCFPFQHPSDSPLPTDVFPQSVGVESV
jgi:hypothetical protein